jgi:hypothetical protein
MSKTQLTTIPTQASCTPYITHMSGFVVTLATQHTASVLETGLSTFKQKHLPAPNHLHETLVPPNLKQWQVTMVQFPLAFPKRQVALSPQQQLSLELSTTPQTNKLHMRQAPVHLQEPAAAHTCPLATLVLPNLLASLTPPMAPG